jgi:hypothetical protein
MNTARRPPRRSSIAIGKIDVPDSGDLTIAALLAPTTGNPRNLRTFFSRAASVGDLRESSPDGAVGD